MRILIILLGRELGDDVIDGCLARTKALRCTLIAMMAKRGLLFFKAILHGVVVALGVRCDFLMKLSTDGVAEVLVLIIILLLGRELGGDVIDSFLTRTKTLS